MQKKKSPTKAKTFDGTTFDVVFGFDMETDIGSFTPYYEGVQHGTPRLLDLMAKHDIQATFFLDGPRCREQSGDGLPRARRRP